MRMCILQAHALPAAEADDFFVRVQRNALNASLGGGAVEFTDPQQLMYVAVRLWTSAEKLRGRELCSMLNEATRADAAQTIDHTVMVVQACSAPYRTVCASAGFCDHATPYFCVHTARPHDRTPVRICLRRQSMPSASPVGRAAPPCASRPPT